VARRGAQEPTLERGGRGDQKGGTRLDLLRDLMLEIEKTATPLLLGIYLPSGMVEKTRKKG